MVRVSSPPQSWSKAVVCVSTPRMYPRSGYFLVYTIVNSINAYQEVRNNSLKGVSRADLKELFCLLQKTGSAPYQYQNFSYIFLIPYKFLFCYPIFMQLLYVRFFLEVKFFEIMSCRAQPSQFSGLLLVHVEK